MYESTREISGSVAKRSVAEIIAKSTFAIYLFCIIFGTSLPFEPPIEDVAEKSTSSVVNQIVYSTLFVLSLGCILNRWKPTVLIIKREKFLTLFLAWCLISITWSDYSFISFKRLIQILTTVTVSFAVLSYTESPDDTLKFFKFILFFYIPLSFLSVLFVSGAIQPQSTAWRGLAEGKNHFSQVCLISCLIWTSALRSGAFKENIVNFVMLILSLVLLIGSQSITSIFTALILGCTGCIYYLNSKLKSLGIGAFFIILATLTFFGISISLLLLGPDLMRALPEFVGKDATFTGRTDLWEYILDEARNHFIIGSGFGGYWVIDSYFLNNLYQNFVWLPNQSHNGYLDILNETGLVGLAIFFAMVVYYLRHLLSIEKFFIWKWFFIAALIINFQETTLFRPNIFTGVIFVFSYLALYAELSTEKEQLA